MSYIIMTDNGEMRSKMRENMRRSSGNRYFDGNRNFEDGYREGYRHGWEDSEEENGESYRRERDSRGRYM